MQCFQLRVSAGRRPENTPSIQCVQLHAACRGRRVAHRSTPRRSARRALRWQSRRRERMLLPHLRGQRPTRPVHLSREYFRGAGLCIPHTRQQCFRLCTEEGQYRNQLLLSLHRFWRAPEQVVELCQPHETGHGCVTMNQHESWSLRLRARITAELSLSKLTEAEAETRTHTGNDRMGDTLGTAVIVGL